MFERKAVFKIKPKEDLDSDELELELIDYGVDELETEDEDIVIYGEPESFARIQKYLEENEFEIVSAEFERFPNETKELTPEQEATINKLIERLEEDEDVSNVYHNMKESLSEEDA